jgi:hypothetical protein
MGVGQLLPDAFDQVKVAGSTVDFVQGRAPRGQHAGEELLGAAWQLTCRNLLELLAWCFCVCGLLPERLQRHLEQVLWAQVCRRYRDRVTGRLPRWRPCMSRVHLPYRYLGYWQVHAAVKYGVLLHAAASVQVRVAAYTLTGRVKGPDYDTL